MHYKKENGQAMVEFALLLPILILLIGGIIDFGWIFGNKLLINNACREAARYTAIHYNDSSTDDDQAVAYNIVIAALPSGVFHHLDEDDGEVFVDVAMAPSGENISISLESDINVLTPFLSTILGETYNIDANCVMRIE